MKPLISIIILVFLFGCASEEKLRSKAKAFYKMHPEELAEFCNDEYPVPEIDREIIPGDTIVKEKVITVPGKEIECPEATPEKPIPTVKCPDCESKVIEKTIRDTVKVTVKDTREIFLYQTELKKVNESLENYRSENENIKQELRETKNTRNNMIWVLVLFGFGLLVFLGIKIFR